MVLRKVDRVERSWSKIYKMIEDKNKCWRWVFLEYKVIHPGWRVFESGELSRLNYMRWHKMGYRRMNWGSEGAFGEFSS